MRPRRLHTLARVAGKRARLGAMCAIVCVTSLAACGGGGEDPEPTIPPQTGENIVTKLEDVQSQVDAGECATAELSALQIEAAISDLGPDVKGDLEEALVKASGNLVTLVREDCQPADEPDPQPEPPTGPSGEEGVLGDEG
jgi:hypothetical protein